MRDEVFSDDIFSATELNRHAGTILDRARKRPVTISRNNDLFALLPREQAARLVGTTHRIAKAVAVLSEANAALSGVAVSPTFEWLAAYDQDDLRSLVTELLHAARNAASGETDWDDVEALIHEWEESALVAESGVLDRALDAQADEAPLALPEEILQTQANPDTHLE